MPSINRSLADESLFFRTAEEVEHLVASEAIERTGRSARTLVKDGPLRVTLVAIGAGGSIPAHSSAGPITVHVLSGDVDFEVAGTRRSLVPGDLLSVGGGVEHEVSSRDGGAFLLTVANPPAETND